jgi:preprotein translocase subunit SecF
MQFFGDTHIGFARFRNRAYMLSLAFIVVGLVSLLAHGGPRLSIDFEGGTLVQVRFDEPVAIADLRRVIVGAGYSGGEIQRIGQTRNEYIIRIEKVSETDYASQKLLEALNAVSPGRKWRISSVRELPPDFSSGFEGGTSIVAQADSVPPVDELVENVKAHGLGVNSATSEAKNQVVFNLPLLGVQAKAAEKLSEALEAGFPGRTVEIRRTESVGPRIGAELKNRAWAAIVISLFGILAYISWRFEFRFAVGAIVALVHDVTITLGIFSLLGKEISITVMAAFLTIVGYSLNDTIVVFDRIRENFGLRRRETFETMIDISINETLSRTINTSVTTLIVILFLLFMGGEVIHDFAFALTIGIIVGTYSSIFVASPILIEWEHRVISRKKPVAAR